MLGKPRSFKNSFSVEINDLNENEIDGIIITNKRFKYFIESVSQQIENDNKKILEEFQGEEYDVASSMLNQFHVDSNLNYFLDTILKSNLVAIYSNFENRLDEISEICKRNLPKTKCTCEFKNGSIINKRNAFLKSEIIPKIDSLKSDFNQILIWNRIRNDIVHNNSITSKFNPESYNHSSLIIEHNKILFKNSNIIIEFLELTSKYLMNIIDYINEKYQLIE